jgi:lysyl-tRNA synthetase class 2
MQRSFFIALFASALFLANTISGDPPEAPTSAGIVSHLKREAVQSTALASVGYSKRLHALEIEFRNGAIYRYLDVDASVYRRLMNAPSKARFYDENIRHKYRSLHVRRRTE